MKEPSWRSPALIIAGALLLLWRHRREFRRANRHGVPQYGSYWQKLRAERLDSALSGLGYSFMLAGALLFIFTDNTLASWIALGVLVPALKARRCSSRD